MNRTLIKAFGVCTAESTPVTDYNEFMMESIKRGYLIPKEIANEDTFKFLQYEAINYNSTFYNNWLQVRDSSRFEQFIDQIIHYMTNGAYVVNDGGEEVDMTTYKVIECASAEDVFQKCIDMIYSGIALSDTMINAILDFIENHKELAAIMLDINQVQNRDVQNRLRMILNIRPETGIDLLKWIVYLTTGMNNIVKSKGTMNAIKIGSAYNTSRVFDFSTLTEKELVELSKIFYRFKPIFLAFRCKPINRPIINRIRRMAKKNHTPMKEGFWQTILSNEHDLRDVKNRINELNSFKIVSLIQTIAERINISNGDARELYFIRNGKIWMGDEPVVNKTYQEIYGVPYEYVYMLYLMFTCELINRLKTKKGTVKFPKNLNLVCPVSEKKFAGPLPYGSYYELSEHNFFGIYWREEDGTRDFDLSLIDDCGRKVGWDATYKDYNANVMFSGDMTRAIPEASEVLYFKNGCDVEGTLYINRFNGDDGSKYKYYFGQEDIKNFHENYMVDPNCIVYTEESESNNRQEMLGMIHNNRIYICKFGNGQDRVSVSKYGPDEVKALANKLDSCVPLKSILIFAGFTEWNDSMITDEVKGPDYDLTDLNKDTLIKLFTD